MHNMLTIRAKSFALVLVLLFNLAATAETVTEFQQDGIAKEEVSLVFEESDSDDSVSLEYPNVEVLDASFKIRGSSDDEGNYPDGIKVTAGNSKLWAYGSHVGDGYGALGQQTTFSGGESSISVNFEDDTVGVFDVLLPADICGSMPSTDGCSITGASVDITGLSSPPDDFEAAIHASEDTNGGSVSGHDRNDDMTSGSNFAIDDSGNIHAIWLDNGDLNSEDNFAQDVFYSNWDGNDWSDIVQLSSAADDDYIDTTPQIAVSGQNVYALWGVGVVDSAGELDFQIHFTSSISGDGWTTPVDIKEDGDGGYLMPAMAVQTFTTGTDIHVTWRGIDSDTNLSKIMYRASNDGGVNWNTPTVVSEAENADAYKVLPDIVATSGEIHIVWVDNSTTIAGDTTDGSGDTVWTSCSNDCEGEGWSTPVLVSTGSDGDTDVPMITIDDDGGLHAVWTEFSESTIDIVYHYCESQNGCSTTSGGDEDVLATSTADMTPVWPSIIWDGDDNLYVAWSELGDDTDSIVLSTGTISSFGGSTSVSFTASSTVDDGTESRGRRDVVLDIDNQDFIWAGWMDREQKETNEDWVWTGTDQDYYFKRSSQPSQAWDGSSWDEGLPLVSDNFYHGESSSVSVASDSEYTYMVYYDSGDLMGPSSEGNGNDAHLDDGDILFARSSNGEDWEDFQTVSNRDMDGSVYLVDAFGDSMVPTIAASGNGYVYAAWMEMGRDTTADGSYYVAKILTKYSDDYGSPGSWSDVIELDTAPDSSLGCCVDSVKVSISDNTVHWVWRYINAGTYDSEVRYTSSSLGGAIPDHDVVADRSMDVTTMTGSILWSTILDTDNSNTLVGWLEVVVDAGFIDSGTTQLIISENGDDWSGVKEVPHNTPDGGTTFHIYTPPIATLDGQNINVLQVEVEESTYLYELYYRSSSNLGDRWDSVVTVSGDLDGDYIHNPFMINENGVSYATFNYYDYAAGSFSEYYYIFSTDGSDWSDPLLVSDSNTLAELSFAGLTYSESLVVAWAEIVEEDDGTLHFNVMSRLADGSGYPNDPKLRVGGIEVWEYFGEYSETQTLEGTEFEQALEQAIMEGTAVEDEYGTPMVLVTFVVDVSQFGGSLLFSNLKITYEAELTVNNSLSDKLNSQNSEEDPANVPLLFQASSGILIVNGLEIETVDADLKFSHIELDTYPLYEANDLGISITIENSETGDASTNVQVWYEDNDAVISITEKNVTVPARDSDGNSGESTFTVYWSDMPEGEFDLIIEIGDSSPTDISEDSGDCMDEDAEALADSDNDEVTAEDGCDIIKISVEILKSYPIFEVDEFGLDGVAIEGENVDVEVDVTNIGTRNANVDVCVYENSGGNGNSILDNCEDKSIPRDADYEDEDSWTVNPNVESLWLRIVDSENGTVYLNQPLDIVVKYLPDFEVINVVWTDLFNNDVMTTYVTDGTSVNGQVFIQNTGSFDVITDFEVMLCYPAGVDGKDDCDGFIYPDGSTFFSNQEVDSGETITLDIDFDIDSNGRENTDWSMLLIAKNIDRQNDEHCGLSPQDDQECSSVVSGVGEVIDTSYVIEVAGPPDVRITNVQVSDDNPGAGDTIQFTVELSNSAGDSGASGDIGLYLEGSFSSIGNGTFEIERYDSSEIYTVEWAVPMSYKGAYNFEVRLENIYPEEGDFSDGDNSGSVSIDVTALVIPDEGGSLDITLIAAAGVGLLALGLVAAFVMSRRNKGGDGLDELQQQAPPIMDDITPPSSPAFTPEVPAGVTVACPTCQTQLKVTDPTRPITVACPGCQTQLRLDS